ncbi:hypothetical protein A2U01_0114209, partial [Trifolium medium]|nr:hypothetical protein [Trifolium medium]
GRFSFCPWRGAQLGLAQRAVLWFKGSFTFWCLRDAQRSPAFSDFLLVFTRRARVVCAARRVLGQG